jgi:hypothetical protein
LKKGKIVKMSECILEVAVVSNVMMDWTEHICCENRPPLFRLRFYKPGRNAMFRRNFRIQYCPLFKSYCFFYT